MDKVKGFKVISAVLFIIVIVFIYETNCDKPPKYTPVYNYGQGLATPPSFLEGLRRYMRQFGISSAPNFGIGTKPAYNQPLCFKKCKPGNFIRPRLGHVPNYNGCGSYGFESALVPAAAYFTDCCNRHDLCYDACGSDKRDCDMQFQLCVYDKCGLTDPYEAIQLRQSRQLPPGPYDNCLSHADLVATGPVIAGCMAFKQAQKKSCECVPVPY
ncbi:unnamed protein product [Orchesella dallaii]|uniref:Group XIIA secretory phospholipase A2 n=1 Tax=Orchesella dallaii TaxID=48710 RepID=A0ABP1R3X0_9HEXA